MAEPATLLTGWGRTAPSAARVLVPTSVADVASIVRSVPARGLLARGLGRSYGDAAQNAGGVVLDMCRLNSISAIDPVSGSVTCGAGASLDALLRAVVPRGWFPPVMPGTRNVTLAGSVAADVHGKNHHRDGSLGRHVSAVSIIDGSGEAMTLVPDEEPYWATVGGMGLTGIITDVTLTLRAIPSAWMTVDTYRTADLEETMARLADADTGRRYSVAWLDCLTRGSAMGRGIVTAADHAPHEFGYEYAPREIVTAPGWVPRRLLNTATIAAFNEAYFRAAPRQECARPQGIAAFFHPLDAIGGWNRLYGAGGFVQYQFVTPAASVVSDVVESLAAVRLPSFLGVLKRFGPGNDRAPLSFPAPGWTLALDLPARVSGLAGLLDELDERVAASGGRVYLAKDARLRPDVFEAMYPHVAGWRKQRASLDPRRVFESDLARRLDL
jgi:decaprenylphospho-beta-D-ribofuranose 2-oxidase